MNLWSRVDELIDGSSDLAGLQTHGLDLYAAHRWRSTGRPVPDAFLEHERAAAMAVLGVPTLLARIRDVLDGPILLIKGPEVAARYPEPSLRPFRDLDILVHDADSAHRSLVDAGWEAINSARPHHPPELLWPGSMVSVEIHTRPNWPWWTRADVNELFACAVPSALDLEGIQTLPPAHHAVLLAAHSWQHEPFRRLLDLIDVAAMMEHVDAPIAEEVAMRWGLGPVWQATTHSIDAFLDQDLTLPRAIHLMARHCWNARQRTYLESRLAFLAGGMWAPTPSEIAAATTARVLWSVLPQSRAREMVQRTLRRGIERTRRWQDK